VVSSENEGVFESGKAGGAEHGDKRDRFVGKTWPNWGCAELLIHLFFHGSLQGGLLSLEYSGRPDSGNI
jgi:hypothetical protein